MKSKIILEQIGLQVPMLHNLKCCKNNWCLWVQFAPGKFGNTLSWKKCQCFRIYFIPAVSRFQDPVNTSELCSLKSSSSLCV